jgi:putative two-component system response regulator
LKQNPRLCDTPVLFVSGRIGEQDMQHGLELGAVDYITKPFDALDFAPRLLSYIKIEGESDFIAAAKGRFQKI